MTGKLISFIRRKIFRINSYRWDHQYASGQWDSLRTDEMERLLVAKQMLQRHARSGNVLEVGCGEGVFFAMLSDVRFNFYEGLDLSEVAISRIKKSDNSLFVSGDMETYQPVHQPFSVIVFNEVLYYSKNPTELLKRYSRYLSADGVFLVGMHESEKSKTIWESAQPTFVELESEQVEKDGKVWHYKVLKI